MLTLEPSTLVTLIPGPLYSFYEELFPPPFRRTMVGVDQWERKCAQILPSSTVFYEHRPRGGDLVASAARMRAHVWGHVGAAPARNTFVYVEREGLPRSFTAAAREALRDMLHPSTQFVPFFGSESFADTGAFALTMCIASQSF